MNEVKFGVLSEPVKVRNFLIHAGIGGVSIGLGADDRKKVPFCANDPAKNYNPVLLKENPFFDQLYAALLDAFRNKREIQLLCGGGDANEQRPVIEAVRLIPAEF